MNIRKGYLNTRGKIIKWEGILGGNLGWRASYPRFVIYYFLYQTKGIFIVGTRYCADYLTCITHVILWGPYEVSTVSGTTFQTVKLQLKEVNKHSQSHKNTWQAALKLGPSFRGCSSKWALLSLMCMTAQIPGAHPQRFWGDWCGEGAERCPSHRLPGNADAT